MSTLLKYIINACLFQIGWLVCVFFGSNIGLLATVLILGLHFFLIVEGAARRFEVRTLATALGAGLLLESLFIGLGVLERVDGGLTAPIWLLLMWVLFATTLNYSLAWLKNRFWLAVFFGFIASPGSYYAGALISPEMNLGEPSLINLFIIAVCWALVLPILIRSITPKRLVGDDAIVIKN